METVAVYRYSTVLHRLRENTYWLLSKTEGNILTFSENKETPGTSKCSKIKRLKK